MTCIAMDTEDDLSFYLMDYHPYYGGKNPNHYPGSDSQTLAYLKSSDRRVTPEKTNLLRRISDWLKGVLDIPIAPEHSSESTEHPLHALIKNMSISTSEASETAHGEVKNQSLREETIEVIDPLKVKDIVIAIAPGHSPESPENFLHPIIGNLIGGKIKDGRDLLKRTEKVQKATKGGPRDQSLHEKTIKVTDPSKVKNKVVYIIDDVWTTGSTLRACASLMRKAGASDVKLLAVGKTVSMQHDD